MHPDIKKFWEKQGRLYGPTLIQSWELYIPLSEFPPISKIETVCHGDMYQFQSKWYSEEEMLGILKLIAFA